MTSRTDSSAGILEARLTERRFLHGCDGVFRKRKSVEMRLENSNNVVESGEIDANYFQHTPYLDDFNQENGTHIVSVAPIHVEPIGIYGGKQTTLDAIKK